MNCRTACQHRVGAVEDGGRTLRLKRAFSRPDMVDGLAMWDSAGRVCWTGFDGASGAVLGLLHRLCRSTQVVRLDWTGAE